MQGRQAGVVVDENDALQIGYLQSSHMRKLFDRFPEILLIDGTYNVNSHGMTLYCIMIEDGFGHGRVVFYVATTEEDALHLRKMLQCFKEKNPSYISTNVIIIDEDFSEWKILREELPNAVVLFCQWNVIKAMFKHLSDAGVDVMLPGMP